MKKIIYIICLIATWIAGELIVSGLLSFLTKLFSLTGYIRTISVYTVGLLASIIPILVLYRVLIFIKTRSLTLPNNFTGLPLTIACISVVPALITIIGYIILAAKGTTGLSGIPLGFILIGSSFFAVIPVIYCEFKEFYEFLPSGKKT